MRIGILGTRGIPNAYGGFEQCAQYLALGLSQRGHEVYVYNSSDHPYRAGSWNGVTIIHCRDLEKRIGTAGQFIYDYHCFRDAARRNFDILLQLGYTSSSVWHRFWPRNAVNVVNMDGLEWKRSKYSGPVRRFLRVAERWAARYGDVLVADSTGIRSYLSEKYHRDAIYIPYGAEVPPAFDPAALASPGLQPAGYMMLMARMEPENNIEMVIRGWLASAKDKPLIVVGNTGNRYGQFLTRRYRHEGLRFLGAIYDQPLVNALRHYSSLYFHGHSVGGTNPSLLEAMACGCAIAAHDNPFNRAILGEDAGYFSSPETVTALLDAGAAESFFSRAKAANRDKVLELYNWNTVVAQYERLFLDGASVRTRPI